MLAPPQILLFGHPGSGKTHLLGALLRASDAQPAALGGTVADLTGHLEPVRAAVYADGNLKAAGTEVNTFRVQYRTPEPTDFVLIDCDGRASTALLKAADALEARRVTGTVARAVLGSDLLVLVIDATLNDDDRAERFEDFLFFLEQVHGRRLRDREVGGLPVFVVLTRCDLLAKPGDTTATWEAEVRWHLAKVRRQFEEFVDDQLPFEGHGSSSLPFGSVDVEDYATAVRRPPLADAPKPEAEPFGVAELFHDAFRAAAAHRTRARASDTRLRHTVWAVAAGVLALLAGAVAVTVFAPATADPQLPERVKLYARGEPAAAVRLAEPTATRNKRLLASYRADPGFFALPADLQAFVEGRLREVDDYQAYRAKLAAQPAPSEARTLDELERVRAKLAGELALPAEYTWGDTEAARLRDKWLADAASIRGAEAAWHDWYRGLLNQATALTLTGSFAGDWRDRVNRLADAGTQPPFALGSPLPGSEALPGRDAVTYRVPFEYDRVYQARRDWEYARGRLLHLRDLADALALTPSAERRPLLIPPPGSGLDATAFPAGQLAELRTRFPRGGELYPADVSGYPEWELSGFPDPARSVLAGRVRESFASGAAAVRTLVAARLNGDDTPAGWARAAEGLSAPPFAEWGRLLHVLAKLEERAAGDPVAGLAAFLRAPEFAFDLRGAELTIPLVLRNPPLVPAGPLTVTVTPRAGGEPVVRTFAPVGEPVPRDLTTAYTFGAAPPFTYRPGDALRAELPVRSGAQAFTLTWDAGGSRTFQFDRLAREPRLGTEPATGVRLAPAAGSVVPRVPALLPEVR
ncbi:P-loop NTPase family protein [Urbifossiella limnaea]|uniref:Uncharacterized protein n=1 Tax=Urbifossiella limnaea TaxID=2528023 RepID=A0A517XZS7_9BACT|nr:hypothetical protein [Urbifossiella limnaea]QDU23014.1 hypothetical protein ETAA1_50040 [Urbifossiella limnaea]